MYFKEVKKTSHYIKEHEKYVPWSKVIEVITESKNRRKKGDKIEIKTKKYYVLCQIKERILWVINAKRINK